MRSIYLLLSALLLTSCMPQTPTSATAQKSTPAVYTLNNNGDKIRWQTPRLQAGNKVFNVSTGEYGTVVGDIVVTSQALPADMLRARYKINSLSGNNYRLTPINKIDLAAEMMQLQQNEAIDVVELLVDYSRPNQAAIK